MNEILHIKKEHHLSLDGEFVRCLRCHRGFRSAKSRAFRGIGPDCWRAMRRRKAEDRLAPTLPWDGDSTILARDRDGTTHHNIDKNYLIYDEVLSEEYFDWGIGDPCGSVRLAAAILGSARVAPFDTIRRLSGPFAAEFLADLPEAGGIIAADDVRAWIREHAGDDRPE